MSEEETKSVVKSPKRDRSPEYPAISLRTAVEQARRVYDQDRQNWTSAEVAARHLGYSGISGTSRTALSALKKFGLIEYRGGDLRVTDMAMRILLPHTELEKAQALATCLTAPKMYLWAAEEYPGWELPSDETLHARLVRDLEFNPSATRGFIADLRESIEFVKQSGGLSEVAAEPTRKQEGDATKPIPESAPPVTNRDGHRLSVPGQEWFVWLPDDMKPAAARSMMSWVKKVLLPNLEFISDPGMNDGEEE